MSIAQVVETDTAPAAQGGAVFDFAAGLAPLALVAIDPLQGSVLGLAACITLCVGAAGLSALRSLLLPWLLMPLLFLLTGSVAFLIGLALQVGWPVMGAALHLHLPLMAACSTVLLGARELALQKAPLPALREAVEAAPWIWFCLFLCGAFCALLNPAYSLSDAQYWLTASATASGPTSDRFSVVSLLALGLALGLCRKWKLQRGEERRVRPSAA